MKKYLLASTAIVAATALSTPSFAADPIKLKLGGYFAGFAAFIDDDGTDLRDFAFGQDSEVHVKGKTTLDNGIKVSFKAEIELEDDTAAGASDLVDEVNISFAGGFGKITFGQEDGASSKMRIKTPTPFMRIGADDVEDVELLDETMSTQLETEIGDSDATKLLYNTPRIAGFQLGVSYAPESSKDNQGLGNRDEGDGDEELEFGVNFKHDANGVKFGAAFTAYTDDRLVTPDAEHYNIGAQIGFGSFTFGGNYTFGDQLETDASYDSGVDEGKLYSLGGVYKNGPWKLGAQYFRGEEDKAGGDEEYTSYMGGVTYAFGPKMTIGGGILYREDDLPGGSTDGTAFFMETGLKF